MTTFGWIMLGFAFLALVVTEVSYACATRAVMRRADDAVARSRAQGAHMRVVMDDLDEVE